MPEPSIAIERRGPTAWLTLRPKTIGAAVIGELHDACESIRDDNDMRVAVLAGGASDWDPALLRDPDAARQAGLLGDPFGCLAELPKPVIAAIDADATGGGLALALAADIRIASEGARFGFSEGEMGLVPMAAATQRLSRLVGRGKALELILTGARIDANEALRIGLVSEVVPAGKLEARAHEIAERIAERGPLAVRYAKEAVSRGIDMPLEQALRFETDLTVILQTTEDRAEGVRAFLDKRKPKFKGK
jgi:enoyl-CoA hydratase